MITKAIVESIVDDYSVKVRIPIWDRVKSSNVHTPDNELTIATVCTLPNCKPNFRVGDIVFVAIEETYPVYGTVIIGWLFRDIKSDAICDMIIDDLIVKTRCTLPDDTSIGEVEYGNLKKLLGVSDNIQSQLNSLSERISMIEQRIFQNNDTTDDGGE